MCLGACVCVCVGSYYLAYNEQDSMCVTKLCMLALTRLKVLRPCSHLYKTYKIKKRAKAYSYLHTNLPRAKNCAIYVHNNLNRVSSLWRGLIYIHTTLLSCLDGVCLALWKCYFHWLRDNNYCDNTPILLVN